MNGTTGAENNAGHSIVEYMIPGSETKLVREIRSLLSNQRERRTTSRRTRGEMTTIRRQLGEKLHALKGILSRSGRGGQWSSYLRANQIPRASADRLVAAHETLLHPLARCPTEAITLATEREVRQFARDLLPKVRRIVKTPDAVFQFMDELGISLQSAICGRPDRSIQ